MTTEEVAIALGISMRRVQAIIKHGTGNLRAVKQGRDWYIDPQDVEVYKMKIRKAGRPKKRPTSPHE